MKFSRTAVLTLSATLTRSCLRSVVGLALIAPMAFAEPVAGNDDIVPATTVSEVLTLKDVAATNEKVTGRVVNLTGQTIREIQLIVHHAWLWKNERQPGKDSPGRTEFFLIPDSVSPQGEITFEYRPAPPLPARDDGHFETRVEIIAFTEVGA